MEICDPKNPSKKYTIDVNERAKNALNIFMLETNVMNEEATLDKFYEEAVNELANFQLKLEDLYLNDKVAYGERLASLDGDGEFKVQIVNGEHPVKFYISENPVIHLDTPLFDGESKADRFEKIMAFYFRFTYLNDIADAKACLDGKVGYEDLSNNAKNILSEIVAEFADVEESTEN